jgi:hypothetical protein
MKQKLSWQEVLKKKNMEYITHITFWIRERSCGKMALCSLVKTIAFSWLLVSSTTPSPLVEVERANTALASPAFATTTWICLGQQGTYYTQWVLHSL